MPYIRGRYYMNPVVGDALEAAREAEAALQASNTPQKWRAATQAKKRRRRKLVQRKRQQ